MVSVPTFCRTRVKRRREGTRFLSRNWSACISLNGGDDQSKKRQKADDQDTPLGTLGGVRTIILRYLEGVQSVLARRKAMYAHWPKVVGVHPTMGCYVGGRYETGDI